MVEILTSDDKVAKGRLPSDRAFGPKDILWLLRKIRRLLLGRLIPAKRGAVPAFGSRRREYHATKLAFRNDFLTGVVADRRGGPAPDAVFLHAGGILVEPLARDPQALRGDVDPRSGRFVVDLRGRSVASLLRQGATLRSGDGRQIGQFAELGHRIVQLKWAELADSDLCGAFLLDVSLTEPIDLVIDIDGIPAATITIPPNSAGSIRDFVVPIEEPRRAEVSVTVRLDGAARPVVGSPRRARQRGDRVLVANSDFSRWSAAVPQGWTVALAPGAIIEPAGGTPIALQGLDFGRGGCLLRDESGTGALSGATLSQTMTLPQGGVDVVLVARASAPVPVSIALAYAGSLVQETAAIGTEMAVHHLRLPAAAAAGEEVELRVTLADASPDVQIAFLAAGPPGLGLADAAAGRSVGTDNRSAGNAVVNGRFIAWSGPFRRQIGTREVQIAPGFRLVSRGEPGKVDLRLSEILTRDLRTGASGDILYGPALIGPCGKGLRIEARLDRMELLALERAHLSFYARRGSSATPGATFAGAATSSIREISLVERRTERPDASSRQVERRFSTIKRDVPLGQSGEYFSFPIRLEDWQRLRQASRASASDPSAEYLLVLEFIDTVDIALTDVAIGETPSVDDRTDGLDGFRSLECAFVRAQLPLLRGIEHWGRPQRVVVPDAALAAERTQAAARWAWPADPSLSADIVVCVHEAMDETMDCLRSIERNTSVPHTLTIVDDFSSEATREQLRQYAAVRPWVRLMENKSNLGYTRSANIGLSSSDAPWIVLLNSDTIVTPGWLTGLFEPVIGRSDVAMVGPLSNAASWQSVPEVHNPKGGWMVNRLPDGMTVDDMAAVVTSLSQRAFPSVALLNGFCTLMRRSALEDVGFLDEESFPVGYGEENDLCLRLHKRGYKLLVADHVYVYHVKSASFGPEKRTELVKLGHKRLLAKHPDVDLAAAERELAEAVPLITLRRRLLDHLAAR